MRRYVNPAQHQPLLRIFVLTGLLIFFLASLTFGAASADMVHQSVRGALDVVVLVTAGVFIGILGTLIGAGGGFLHVPMLIIIYGFSPQHAIGTSMAVVFLNTLSGTFAYIAQKKIDYELAIKFSVFAAPGVIIGAFLAQKFDIVLFSILFSIVLLLLAYVLLFVKEFYLVWVFRQFFNRHHIRPLRDWRGSYSCSFNEFPGNTDTYSNSNVSYDDRHYKFFWSNRIYRPEKH